VTDLKFLISKLNTISRTAAEKAATLAVARGNPEVRVEHLLLGLAGSPQSDAVRIFQHFAIDREALERDVNAVLQTLVVGNVRTPVLSDGLVKVLSQAWAVASNELALLEIRSAAIMLVLAEPGWKAQLIQTGSAELMKLDGESIRRKMASLISPDEGAWEAASAEAKPDAQSALSLYTIDLTASARAGALDPVFGRELEIRQVIDILMRRRQNNPILTGEPGVGKTAIAEGFALRVAAGDVPASLRNVSVRTLDHGLLLAGASMRGEMESRLKAVMREIQASPQPIILFVDEAHTLIGGNDQQDAANLLKPALARGDLRTIAATTHAEYRRYFEKDPALARRFQVVAVGEPSEEQAIQMLRPLVPMLERHHQVRVDAAAVESAVQLSHRYITGRQLPDKAISVLDTACARVASSQNSTPPAIEDCQHRVAVLEGEVAELERERVTNDDVEDRLAVLFDQLAEEETRLADLEDRCRGEKELVRKTIEIRTRMESRAEDRADLRDQLREANEALAALQGDSRLVPAVVDSHVVAEVVSATTGIPVGRVVGSGAHTVLNLRNLLAERVAGQSHALEIIARRIISARAGLEDPGRPTGVFLLAGPSGVGKTETALALSEILYGGERNAIVLNMTEFQEAYSISGLKGSPPGYTGYGEGGVLTEAVRRRPYSVVLLDEMEKAHSDVHELFYQVFDKGIMEDAQGRTIDFRNTLILMTSNIGADTIQRMFIANPAVKPDQLREAIGAELRNVFKPALLARMTVVPYFPISDSIMRRIIELKVDKIVYRLLANHDVHLQIDERLVDEIASRCLDRDSGARNIDHILSGTLIPEISEKLLCAEADRRPIVSIYVDVGNAGAFRYRVE
jgi:type VI secretion system protein VasG